MLLGVFAVMGRTYYATWSQGPVSGSFYWLTVALSPEVLIFAFFMITDPLTAPRLPLGRIVYAVSTAFVAAALIAFQTTEFGIKVALLSSLILTCALVPIIEKVVRGVMEKRSGEPASQREPALPLSRRMAVALRNPVLVTLVIIAVAAPINAALLGREKGIVLIERGLTPRNVQ